MLLQTNQNDFFSLFNFTSNPNKGSSWIICLGSATKISSLFQFHRREEMSGARAESNSKYRLHRCILRRVHIPRRVSQVNTPINRIEFHYFSPFKRLLCLMCWQHYSREAFLDDISKLIFPKELFKGDSPSVDEYFVYFVHKTMTMGLGPGLIILPLIRFQISFLRAPQMTTS